MFLTTTFTAPAECAGDLAVIEVEETRTTLVADVPPKVTVRPVLNPVPVIVTDVPPAGKPPTGEMVVTVGAAAANAEGASNTPDKLLRKMAITAISPNLFKRFMKSKPYLANALTANVIDSLKLNMFTICPIHIATNVPTSGLRIPVPISASSLVVSLNCKHPIR